MRGFFRGNVTGATDPVAFITSKGEDVRGPGGDPIVAPTYDTKKVVHEGSRNYDHHDPGSFTFVSSFVVSVKRI